MRPSTSIQVLLKSRKIKKPTAAPTFRYYSRSLLVITSSKKKTCQATPEKTFDLQIKKNPKLSVVSRVEVILYFL